MNCFIGNLIGIKLVGSILICFAGTKTAIDYNMIPNLSPNQSPKVRTNESPNVNLNMSPNQSSNQSPNVRTNESPNVNLNMSPNQSPNVRTNESPNVNLNMSPNQSPNVRTNEIPNESPNQRPNDPVFPIEIGTTDSDETDDGTTDDDDDHNGNEDKPAKTNSRMKKLTVNECLVCDAVIHERIDRHLNKVHLDKPESLRLFLNDFYKSRGAQVVKGKRVYYCMDCQRRFGSIPSHKRAVQTSRSQGNYVKREGKNIERVKNPADANEFPDWVKNMLSNKRGYEEEHILAINEWCEKITTDEKRRGRRQFTCLPDSTLAKTMAIWFHSTRKFHKNTLGSFGKIVDEWRKTVSCGFQTTQKYLYSFTKFLNWYCTFKDESVDLPKWIFVISSVNKDFEEPACNEKRQTQEKLQQLVPEQQDIQIAMSKIKEDLQQNLKEDTLKFVEEKALVYFIQSVRMNCRPGPLNRFTWEEYQSIKSEGQKEVRTNKHKTGKTTAVAIRVHEDLFDLFDHMKKHFEKKYNFTPLYVFGTPSDKEERSMANYVKETLKNRYNIS